MTANEKARAGLWLLTEAVHDYIVAHPGATPTDIREALGVNSPNHKGERADHLLWGLLNILASQGRARIDQEHHGARNYVHPETRN
jgi:hypothetical protein